MLYKALDIDPSNPTPDLHLTATEPIPRLENDPIVCRILYAKQAEEIGRALYASLPGGTTDQLLIYLLLAKASMLKVRAL